MRGHIGVVQDEVFERREASRERDQRLGVKNMGARPKPFGQNGLGAPQAFVEASQRNGRHIDWPSERGLAARFRRLAFIISN